MEYVALHTDFTSDLFRTRHSDGNWPVGKAIGLSDLRRM